MGFKDNKRIRKDGGNKKGGQKCNPCRSSRRFHALVTGLGISMSQGASSLALVLGSLRGALSTAHCTQVSQIDQSNDTGQSPMLRKTMTKFTQVLLCLEKCLGPSVATSELNDKGLWDRLEHIWVNTLKMLPMNARYAIA